MMHPFRVFFQRPLLRAFEMNAFERVFHWFRDGRRERESAHAFELSFFFSGLNFVSLKIPPTKKGERFSRLLNSNGSNSYVYAVVLTTSVAFSLFFLLLLLIIIILILKSSRWCPSMILRCVCVFVFSDDDTNRERTS